MTKLIVAFVAVLLLLGAYYLYDVNVSYKYERDVMAEWNLADKSSTINAKRQHMDKFVANLERQNLQGKYNALIYETPDNSFDANFVALKTLQQRLHEIEGMDVRSFEYQTAIQQITAQEQGEAANMLDVFRGTWYLKHHFLLWSYVGGIINSFLVLSAIILGLILLFWLIDIYG